LVPVFATKTRQRIFAKTVQDHFGSCLQDDHFGSKWRRQRTCDYFGSCLRDDHFVCTNVHTSADVWTLWFLSSRRPLWFQRGDVSVRVNTLVPVFATTTLVATWTRKRTCEHFGCNVETSADVWTLWFLFSRRPLWLQRGHVSGRVTTLVPVFATTTLVPKWTRQRTCLLDDVSSKLSYTTIGRLLKIIGLFCKRAL